ncbi:MAG: OB-fold domain-containing protein [Thermodesulfobacteriota bacterium]|nr:OB-fold domain-containing protein [Thermodesulfobacteriota bacterium]
MVGITSYGAYIPMYRMNLQTLTHIWGGYAGKGEKAVANWDEDSLTMATESSIDCLNGMDRSLIDGLYFATTTPAYREKQNASIIAKVIDLRRDIITADFTNSVRGGTSALRAAIDAIGAGSAKRFLVAAADCRVAAPDSQFERLFGDGSGALLIGDSDIVAQIEGSASISSEFIDIWKREGDRFVQAWEDRFIITQGYLAHIEEVISILFKKYNATSNDFSKVVFYAHDKRRHGQLAKKLGFDPETKVQDPLISTVGHTGSAQAIMMLVAALEDAKPGDRILFANYGDGADAFILKVTDQIEKVRDRRGIKKNLSSKMELTSYGKYLHFRNLMDWGRKREPDRYGAVSMSWRDRNWVLSCHGHKCRQCGTIQFPMQRICTWCQAKDDFDEIRLSDRKGTLFTYSMDNLATSVDKPTVIAIVNIEGGGRLSTILTDRDPEKISPDMPVEFTFRRVHEAQGVLNYFWKCRPLRG